MKVRLPMDCQRVQELMEEFQDGELDAKLAAGMEAHLNSCDSCAAMLERLREEENVYRRYREQLQEALSVHPLVWEEVQARLTAAEREPAPVPAGRFVPLKVRLRASFMNLGPQMRIALAATLLVVLSVSGTLVTVRYFKGGEHGTSTKAGVYTGKDRDLASAIRSIHNAEQEYIQAIQVLNTIIDKRRPSLDPALISELDGNLRIIDESIAATRRAYLAHPYDPELAHYMLAAYSKKVELLLDLAS